MNFAGIDVAMTPTGPVIIEANVQADRSGAVHAASPPRTYSDSPEPRRRAQDESEYVSEIRGEFSAPGLAGVGSRNSADSDGTRRRLELCESGQTMLLEGGFVHHEFFIGDQPRDDDFARPVGQPLQSGDAHLVNARKRADRCFDLRRGHLVSANVDDVLEAAADPQVAVRVEVSEVSGRSQPAENASASWSGLSHTRTESRTANEDLAALARGRVWFAVSTILTSACAMGRPTER